LSQPAVSGLLILGYAVTPLHPGAGRVAGPVDQVVQRDPMGYPIVFASSVKGAFKAECARRVEQKRNTNCFDDNGRVKCGKAGSEEKQAGAKCEDIECSVCCCLFGSEPGTGEQETGLLSILDFTPLFFPVPSLTEGYVYVTTPYLIKRALAILEVLGVEGLKGLSTFFNEVVQRESELSDTKALTTISDESEVYVSTQKFSVSKVSKIEQAKEALKLIEEKAGPLARNLSNRLVVLSDAVGPTYIARGMIRIARVRLRLDTKTDAKGGLWTEEYIPQGTIFLGGFIVPNPRRKNKYCEEYSKICKEGKALDPLNTLIEVLGGNCETYAVIGGKETIGRGLIRLVLYPCEKAPAEKG